MQNVSNYLFIILSFLVAILYYSTTINNINKGSLSLVSVLRREVPMFDTRDFYINSYFSLNKTVIEFNLISLQKIPVHTWTLYFLEDHNSVMYRKIIFSGNPDELNSTYAVVSSYSDNFVIKNTDVTNISSLKQKDIYYIHIEIYDPKLTHLLENKDRIVFRLFIYPFFQDVALSCHRTPYGTCCEELV